MNETLRNNFLNELINRLLRVTIKHPFLKKNRAMENRRYISNQGTQILKKTKYWYFQNLDDRRLLKINLCGEL